MADTPSSSELQQLLDRQAICELVYKYAEGIDRRDGDLLETLFTPDCMLHYAADYDEPASTLIANWRPDKPSPFLVTHHHVGNIRVAFLENGEARSIAYLHAVHKASRDNRIVDEMIRSRYLDRLVRYQGQWRFAERWIVYDWSRVAPSDKNNWWDQPGGTALEGAHGTSDPAFGFLGGERVPTYN